MTYLLQQGCASKSFPNSSINWGPSIQIHESRRVSSDSNQHSSSLHSLPPLLSLPSHQPLHFTLASVLPRGLCSQLLALLGSLLFPLTLHTAHSNVTFSGRRHSFNEHICSRFTPNPIVTSPRPCPHVVISCEPVRGPLFSASSTPYSSTQIPGILEFLQ